MSTLFELLLSIDTSHQAYEHIVVGAHSQKPPQPVWYNACNVRAAG